MPSGRRARDRAEAIAPEAMRQHDDRRRAFLGIRIGEEAAGGGGDAEEAEDGRRHPGAAQPLLGARAAVFTLTV